MIVSVERVSLADRKLLLEWRNSPEVSRWMYTDHMISVGEHDQWFDRMFIDSSVIYWKILTDGNPIGTVFLTAIDTDSKSCAWGIYLADVSARGRGIAQSACLLSLHYAFHVLNLSVVRCEAIRENIRAIALYESVGYKQVGVVVDALIRGSEKISIVKLEIDHVSWSNHEIVVRAIIEEKGLTIRA